MESYQDTVTTGLAQLSYTGELLTNYFESPSSLDTIYG